MAEGEGGKTLRGPWPDREPGQRRRERPSGPAEARPERRAAQTPLGLSAQELVDQEARDRVRTSLEESLLVEAAAGTGKTTELIRRLVAVLLAVLGVVLLIRG